MRPVLLALVGLTMVGAIAARAQDGPGCAKFKWSIAREQAAFGAAGLPAVESGGALPGIALPATAKLSPQGEVAFTHNPGRKPKVEPAFAAVLTLPSLSAGGTYEVTLSDEAWIDVLQDGVEVRSSGFSGQPDCPGVRKSVKFALNPRPTTIQISGAATDSLNIEILPVE